MTPLEDRIRAAIRAKADEIRTGAPSLRLPAGLARLARAGGLRRLGCRGDRRFCCHLRGQPLRFLIACPLPGCTRSSSAQPGLLPRCLCRWVAVWLRADRGLREGGRQAAEPRRGLQQLAGALRDIVRPDDPQARRCHDREDRSRRRLCREHRGRPLRRLPALLCRQCPAFRLPSHHRLRARDERPLVLVGLRARPAVDLRGRLAAHREGVPRPGRRQRHLAVDH
jgi:hypothetical protein